jgi:hypothetical protein
LFFEGVIREILMQPRILGLRGIALRITGLYRAVLLEARVRGLISGCVGGSVGNAIWGDLKKTCPSLLYQYPRSMSINIDTLKNPVTVIPPDHTTGGLS